MRLIMNCKRGYMYWIIYTE